MNLQDEEYDDGDFDEDWDEAENIYTLEKQHPSLLETSVLSHTSRSELVMFVQPCG